MISSYQKSIRVALDTYEHELGIPPDRGPVMHLAESPAAAQKQTKPLWFCLTGFGISFAGFWVTFSPRRNRELKSS